MKKGAARKSTRAARKPTRAARKPARKSAARGGAAKKTPAKKSTRAAAPRKKPTAKTPVATAPPSTGEMFGEGNWKADEEYRAGVREFAEGHDVEELAEEAAEDLEDENEEEGLGANEKGESEEEPEW